MTLRARPTTRKPHRTGADSDSRRNLYYNLGFGAVVLAALAILFGAGFATWYDDHLATVATVNGEAITKDQVRTRVKIESFRLDQLAARTQEQMNLGRISSADGQQRLSIISQQKSSVDQLAISREEDTVLLAQLGRQRNVIVTDAQVDAKLTEEATTAEQRHAWVISVIPEVSTGATEPTATQKDAARTKAEGLLAELKGGTAWDEVVKSSGDSYAATKGDLLYITKAATTPDPKFVAAVFALAASGLTDVVEGDDGTFRIGRVSDIIAEAVDANWATRIGEAGIDLKDYRRVLAASVTRDAIEAQLIKEVVETPSTQRKVSEVFISGSSTSEGGNEVKSRHILYSPKDDPQGAAQLAADDPAWAAAEAEAKAAYEKIKSGQADFADLAKKESDDTGSGAEGGELGWYGPDAGLDTAFAAAIFAPDVKVGDLLQPVRSQFGWHVIQVEGIRAPAPVRAQQVVDAARQPGSDFAALAKANSDGSTASAGGDIGWVARYQLDRQQEDAILGLQAGGVSEVVTTSSGFYVFKVTEVADRLPDATQAETLRSSAFTNWYTGIRDDPTKTTIEELLPGFTSS